MKTRATASTFILEFPEPGITSHKKKFPVKTGMSE
jgi:hypothetical protein